MRRTDLAKAAWLHDPKLMRLLKVLSQEGEGRVVGGAVRNALLKLAVQDIDIATDLLPQDVQRLCRKAGLGVHPTGIEHGTLTIVTDGTPFEVTTLRQDVETDGRRAIVTFTKDWKTDALRRDFTFNAIYVDAVGKIYDYSKGCADIEKRKVKFIGSAEARIREDYLRILRFFRFHAQFGKGAIDAKGLSACRRLSAGLQQLSAERVRQELMKLLAAPGAVSALRAMAKAGILKRLLDHTNDWRVIQKLPADPVLRLVALAADPSGLKDQLRLSNKDADRIKALLDVPHLSPALKARERHRIVYEIGDDVWRDAVWMAWSQSKVPLTDRRWKNLLNVPRRWKRPVFPVKGGMLIGLGVAPGPALGQALRSLEDWWIAGDFKLNKEQLLEHFGHMS